MGRGKKGREPGLQQVQGQRVGHWQPRGAGQGRGS